jgi:hypothetical protein
MGATGVMVMSGMVGGTAQKVVPIAFTTTNFMLANPGMCGAQAGTDNCGHIHVYLDGMTCNMGPYNNDAVASPAQAVLSYCPSSDAINGMHTVSLELHHDDHSPINNSNGQVISASVSITTTGG